MRKRSRKESLSSSSNMFTHSHFVRLMERITRVCELHGNVGLFYCRTCGEMWGCEEYESECRCFCHRTLADYGKILARKYTEHFPQSDAKRRQVMAMAEEAGEFVGAARRFLGEARRTGTFDEMADELADNVITAYVTAEVFEINLDKRIAKKLEVIFSRGWKELRDE